MPPGSHTGLDTIMDPLGLKIGPGLDCLAQLRKGKRNRRGGRACLGKKQKYGKILRRVNSLKGLIGGNDCRETLGAKQVTPVE